MRPVPSLLDSLARDANPSRVLRTIVPVQPAAGADYAAVSVPGGLLWRVQTARARLVTSAVVAGRRPIWTVTDGVNVVAEVINQAGLTASGTTSTTWAPNLGSAFGAATLPGGFVSVPDLWLPAGWTIAIVTNAIDVADQWSQFAIVVDEVMDQPLDVSFEREGTYAETAFGASEQGGQ